MKLTIELTRKHMSLKSDRWIKKMAEERGMIEPFCDHLVREIDGNKIVSYGLSSYGYDLRVANKFKVFTISQVKNITRVT